MMRNIINNSNGHSVNVKNFPNPDDFVCSACATGKLIIRPSPLKVKDEIPAFLERIQGDICGPIQPLSGPFRYFMVLIDASSKWSNACLLQHGTMHVKNDLSDRKSTRLNSSHSGESRMPSSA